MSNHHQSPTFADRSHLPATLSSALKTFFTSVSPLLIAAMALFATYWRWQVGVFSWADGVVVLALIAWWPLNEWLIHTQILHVRPRRIVGLPFDFPIARAHRQHHASPWELRLVFVSLHIHVFAVMLLAGAAFWLPEASLLWTLLAAYLWLGLHYEWVHYLAHIRYEPKLYAKRIREHRLHHFRHEKNWWGVSTGLADRWLGTAPAPTIKRSTNTADILRR